MPVTFPVAQPNGSIQDQDCLTVQELAALLQTTRRVVYGRVESGQWPYMKPVSRILFTPEHVRLILAMSEHRPSGAPSAQRAPSNVRHLGGGR